VDDVPAASAEPQLYGRGVHHDPVPHLDLPGELREDVGPLRPVPEIDLCPLQPAPFFEQADDDPGPERRHPPTLRPELLPFWRS
jgi:hypothetical protein